MRRIVAALLVCTVGAPWAVAQQMSGEQLYEARCAACHAQPLDGGRELPLEAMRAMSEFEVRFTLTSGRMQAQASGLSSDEIDALVAYIAGAGADGRYVAGAAARCDSTDIDLSERAVVRWGYDDHSSGYLGPDTTHINGANVQRLELRWAFGLPETTVARSQPVITADTLFVAAVGGYVFALDRHSGCIKWQHTSDVPLRTSLSLGDVADDGRTLLYFGDAAQHVAALDARTGELVWRTHVGLFDASMLTGSPVPFGDRLIVPISSIEVAMAANPRHECCRSHGAVRLLDAEDGAIVWTARMAPDAQPTTKNEAGVQMWGPSGASIWSTPTVDAKRGRIYVGTGQNTSWPASDMSDAIVAIDLASGDIVWHFQALPDDVFNLACARRGPNCPGEPGPDFDFGASVILTQNSSGKDVLLAGQKSGDVFALDPDDDGRVIWQRKVGVGSALGGVHWGMAVADGKVFVPMADPAFARGDEEPRPGIYALSIDDGALVWEHRRQFDCTPARGEATLYPECPRQIGLSATPTVVDGAVIAGALDGYLRAFSTDDGELLWEYDTRRPFDTVNGVGAHGGALDSIAAQPVGRMLYVQSGYSMFGQMPGNVLLAFELNAPSLTPGDTP